MSLVAPWLVFSHAGHVRVVVVDRLFLCYQSRDVVRDLMRSRRLDPYDVDFVVHED